ncbi:MAG: HAD family hydrolase [Calothrix sp. MO_192.B10]|nr:HAD family hydrolase [Calothrix sp. MO_192.B10]
MTTNIPQILALDFDGVICDGLIEYFAVAWRTYCQVWQPHNQTPPEGLAEQFYPLRAVIETGWEMPVLIKALVEGIAADDIYQNWGTIVQQLVQADNLNAQEIGIKLDRLRDEWIGTDLDGWLDLHQFYPGVVDKIQTAIANHIKVYIITTKEGRFAQRLLQTAGLNLDKSVIFGKEVKRPKYEILRELITTHKIAPEAVYFVEDRLKTLQLVDKQPDLQAVQLYLADWGYNTPRERGTAENHPRIKLISLSEFSDDLWK